MNTRMVVTSKWWFGGGADLTPVLDRRRTQDDADTHGLPRRHAGRLRRRTPSADYARYKQWCEEYFYLPHRKEMRGVGGIFYDYLTPTEAEAAGTRPSPSRRTSAARSCASIPSSCAATSRKPWTEADREEQLVRRGRYVEFNLLYDRGTMFGLKTGGNVESILSSLPPVVKWP